MMLGSDELLRNTIKGTYRGIFTNYFGHLASGIRHRYKQRAQLITRVKQVISSALRNSEKRFLDIAEKNGPLFQTINL
jgi:hypothetical protein